MRTLELRGTSERLEHGAVQLDSKTSGEGVSKEGGMVGRYKEGLISEFYSDRFLFLIS